MPHLKELAKKHAERGLVVLAVHTTFGADGLESYLQEKQIAYPVALDAPVSAGARAGKTVSAYQVDSFPDYYLVDRKGILRYADVANSTLDAAVEELLAER